MKLLKNLLIFIVFVVVILFVVGFFLPKDYNVTRSIHIETNPTHVAAYVKNLNQWPHWSPWEECEPKLDIKVGDKISGVGASQSWSGEQGNGRLEFTEVSEDKVAYTCYFENDTMTADCVMHFKAEGDHTHVEWTMTGRVDTLVVGGYMALMVDKMTAPMFERGLEKLKNAAENKEMPKPEPVVEEKPTESKEEKDRKPISGPATKKN